MLEPVKRRTRADREAEEAAERMQRAEERSKVGQAELAAAKALVVEGTRAYFKLVWPNASCAIPLLDLVRNTMLEVRAERGIKPDSGADAPPSLGCM